MPAGSGRYPSGQRGQTVNLLAYAFGGSNPPLPTTIPGLRTTTIFETGAHSKGGNSSAVERQPSKLGVAGSNPVSRSIVAIALSTARTAGGLFEMGVAPTRRISARGAAVMGRGGSARTNDFAHVAQLAEHALGKGEVSGSIPDMGSRFFSPTKRGVRGR
jgi:hypothetical protein